MKRMMLHWMHVVVALGAATVAAAQQPFDLDPAFGMNISSWYVSSIAPLPDGKVLASGVMRFSGELTDKRLVRLLSNGQRDETFYNSGLGQGKIELWDNGSFYVATAQTVRRILEDGTQDPSFIEMNSDPMFSSLQGGDYHVYPDGRVLMSGVHMLHDTAHGYEGYYCLIWFSNTGYLDTTAHHRSCAGSLDFFTQLPNGQFIGSGSTGIWDGHQASNIIRFNADGSLDSTFQAHVWWGEAYGFLPLPDGRVYAGGNFRMEGISDTLNLVRLMPDGSLDPTFNNTAKFSGLSMNNLWDGGLVRKILPLTNGQIIVTGQFDHIDEESRSCIALMDSSGMLLDTYFTGTGAGNFSYQGITTSSLGIIPAPDGSYYIWGGYHGYDDGTTNDTLQRFVSRLHGFNVGIDEQQHAKVQPLQIMPNPSAGSTVFAVEKPLAKGELSIHDVSGRLVLHRAWPAGVSSYTLAAGALASGTYMVRVEGSTGVVATGKVVVLP